MLQAGKSCLLGRGRTDTSGSRQAPPARPNIAQDRRAPPPALLVNPPAAPRRSARVVAAALLLILHLVAVERFVHLRTTRAVASDRLATLLLTVAPRIATRPPRTAESESEHALRPLVAPLPPVEVEAPPAAVASVIAGVPANAPASGNVAAAPGAARLDLAIPKEFYTHPPALTPAQEAMQDPRSNRLVLTKQEQMDVDFGVVECIAWQREPDGSIYRGPGRWQRVRDVSTNPFTSHRPGQEDRAMECVK